MNVAYSPQELNTYLREATQVSSEYPVVLTRFYTGYREVEMDAVASKGQVSSLKLLKVINTTQILVISGGQKVFSFLWPQNLEFTLKNVKETVYLDILKC